MKRDMSRLPRWGVGFLTVCQVVVGGWALLLPKEFFSLDVVSMGMPYNGHLMRDYGAMTLASAVVLGAATVVNELVLVRTSLLMYLLWAIAHLAVHLTMLDQVSVATAIWLTTVLALAVALPIALLALTLKAARPPSHTTGAQHSHSG